MQIQDIFVSFLCTDVLEIDNNTLADYCRRQVSSSSRMVNGEHGSDFLDTSDPELRELVDAVHLRANALHEMLGFSADYKQEINLCWANQNTNSAITTAHSHADAAFIFVYYPQADENSGELMLMNPIGSAHEKTFQKMHIREMNRMNTSTMFVKPSTGLLVVFPSWIQHYVKPSTGIGERISIALNTNFVRV